ncbi:hypothetical protein K6U06_17860 [Acidiferrimicrobium sp. IK]|nr:hypothetical protein [Acidiferrimicrobium sp. IK]
MTSVKDGCSPQGQCGCCTVLVDGKPRVACVTPLRRVAGRSVTTVDGLPAGRRDALVDAFVAHGASQCGFCTPGILCRLAAHEDGADVVAVEASLLAHLCRCTGWRTVVDAGVAALDPSRSPAAPGPGSPAPTAVVDGAERRAAMEGGVAQQVGADVVLGRGGFSADTAPRGALVAVPDGAGDWAVAATLQAARALVGKVQGRRSGQRVHPPIEVPAGEWALTLATSWVEPGYLEPDASWCEPGGEPSSPLANGGAFGAKSDSPAPAAARMLADRHGATVLAVLSREDVVRLGAKRPPVAAGVRADGTGVLRVARTPGIAEAVASAGPGLVVQEVDVIGPPTSAQVRAAGWAEAAVLLAGLRAMRDGPPPAGRATATVSAPAGGTAEATVTVNPEGLATAVEVTVFAGAALDEVVLRSYVTGAAHMALGWVTTEGLAVDDDGVPEDLTIRSWGILRARDTPPVAVHLAQAPAGAPAVAVSDATFAAVAAATWIALGLPPAWPTSRGAPR